MSLFSDSNAAALPNASSDIVAQVLRQGQKKHGSAGEVEVRLQTSTDGPQVIVPAGFRGPEDRHDGTAQELVNDAPILEDDLRVLGQRVAEEGDDLLAGDAP